MAGHSHSSNIKFRKDRVDQKRAKLFAKLSRMITVGARQGGGLVDANPRLRLAVDKAKVVSMSKDAIDRAIKKGTGEGDVGDYEEFVYEGYGPGGVAIMLEILTDNRNRTAPDVRRLFDDAGGNLAANGAVSWMFERRGVFTLDPSAARSQDELLELALTAGAQDLVTEGGRSTIYCALADFSAVKAALDDAAVALVSAELAYVPNQRTVVADVAVARRVVRLLDAFDDNDDVQTVHSNEDFPDDVARQLVEES